MNNTLLLERLEHLNKEDKEKVLNYIRFLMFERNEKKEMALDAAKSKHHLPVAVVTEKEEMRKFVY